ncbi:hypothetical protein PF001_g10060 [Phytophthora fragariae]|uniref:Uncharacterized protein n=1 Tax=Phytophthora fragariae TaxID=53985 RepID=A0A6A3U1K2_9STRA|nr:hypothetical protein PF006_g10103 [Phytophthora fragariae]KAE9310713.1 hypothetical protein PF001_g10060 [Phytophthora fragariae]
MNALVLTALLFMVVNSVTSVTALTSDAAAQIIAAPDKGDELEDRAYADEQQELEVEIDTRDPNATITTDIYSFVEPTEYVIGLLLDPCRNHAVDCCVDRFGEPAYVDSSATIAEQVSLVDESGATLDVSVSRIGDRPSIFDQNCYLDDNLVPYRLQKTLSPSGLTITRNYTNSRCIGRLRALVPMAEVRSDSCRTATLFNAVGPMSCQTTVYPNGFRTTTLPLFFKGDRTRTICMSDYEIWWVQRTRYNFIVQKKKKFRITSPQCDFDFATNKYKNYHRIT